MFPDNLDKYRNLSKSFRKIIENELREDPTRYSCLHKGHHDLESSCFDLQKFRFSILARDNVCANGDGRNFNCGRTRITLFLGGNFSSDGFVPYDSERCYRWVFCPTVSTDFFVDSVVSGFKEDLPRMKKYLGLGKYRDFVETVLPIVQDNLSILKTLVKDREFCYS